MGRVPNLEKLSYAELIALRDQVDAVMDARKNEHRLALREELSSMARKHGFDIEDVLGRKSGRRGPVPAKYRDPENPENTWTGRGRTPLWLVALLKKRGAKKEDFQV